MTNFFVQAIQKSYKEETGSSSIYLLFPVFVGYTINFMIFQVRCAFRLKKLHGVYWGKPFSAILRPVNKESKKMLSGIQADYEDEVDSVEIIKYRIHWPNIMALTARGGVGFMQLLSYMAVQYYSLEAEINFSLVSNIFAITPFTTAIMFFAIFREKLSFIHMLGIVLISGGIVMLTQSYPSSHEKEEGKISILVPILFALMYSLLNSSCQAISRFAKLKTGIDSFQLILSGLFFEAVLIFGLFLYFPKPYSVAQFC